MKNILLFLLFFIISGCSITERLEKLDKQAGELFFNDNPVTSSVEITSEDKSGEDESQITSDWRAFTTQQQQAIDQWLKENGYNRYGDSQGILYTGGTPLFNEKTGETMNRFEYILQRHPDILFKIIKS